MPEFRLPDLGEGVHEGQIVRLHAKEGDAIKEDDPFMEVETDKAAVEIVSPFTGVIEKWHVEEGQLVNVGDVMVTYRKVGQVSDLSALSQRLSEPVTSSKGAAAGPAAATVEPKARSGTHKPASPATRKLARSLGVDLESINGSGPGGRVTRADVAAAASGGAGAGGTGILPVRDKAQPQTARPRAPVSASDSHGQNVRATVVDLSKIPGEDASDQYGPIKKHALTQARKTIAANMVQSWTTIPHVTDTDDADVTELEKLRKGYLGPQNNNRKLTMLAFVIRAVAQALRRHPTFNAHIDTENNQIIYKKYISIAVGVHTNRGLIAPVIRNTDAMDVLQIADALDEITEKARSAGFAVNDTRGGTYTISNAGAFGGSRYSTPIITPGQCAVLAIGRTRWMPWVVEGELTPRFIMPLSHSFDHRLADGGQEIAFLRDVIEQLENPARLLL